LYFLSFVASSALARLFLEAFRGDSLLLAGGLRAAQVEAWIILAASLYGLYRLQKKSTSPDFTSTAGKVLREHHDK
jgi:prolipoprotein diacylglyceryltransferase